MEMLTYRNNSAINMSHLTESRTKLSNNREEDGDENKSTNDEEEEKDDWMPNKA
jgi:hypothetical protein